MTKKQKKVLSRILISFTGLVILNVLQHFTAGFAAAAGSLYKWIFTAAYAAVYLVIAFDILRKSAAGIVNGQIFDENFLMSVASLGAFGLAVYSGSGDYTEAVAVLVFYETGELFESLAVGKSRKNIASLMDIRPDYANIEKNEKIEKVNPEQIQTGTIILVQPGEKIPLDGIVTEGKSAVNTVALTGESLPRDVSEGTEVVSGSINLSGVLKIKTTKPFGESTVSKILNLVESSTSKKSRSEAFISKFARVYTPFVCCSALVLAVLPPVIRSFFLNQPALTGTWIYRALTFLVISCPCALVISIPLSFFAGIGCASHEGILIKGSNYLETLSKVRTIVFDKTGTLTKGTFTVTDFHHTTISEEELLHLAAHAECASNHPISKSLTAAYSERGKSIDRNLVKDIQEISGKGIVAKVDGKEVAAGNLKLMEEIGVLCEECQTAGTIIHVAVDKNYAGHIVISDVLKDESAEAVSQLKKSGIEKTVMLTGDAQKTAEAAARQLGVDEFYAGLLPQDKVSKVEELLASYRNTEKKLAFCGDGINDAPVLSRSDIGIAMGAMGSDAAIEAADIVLMDDNPLKIARAIKISRKCLGIVYQNIVFAIGIKFLCLLLGALGLAGMWLAIFADTGVLILAILNALRAMRVR